MYVNKDLHSFMVEITIWIFINILSLLLEFLSHLIEVWHHCLKHIFKKVIERNLPCNYTRLLFIQEVLSLSFKLKGYLSMQAISAAFLHTF